MYMYDVVVYINPLQNIKIRSVKVVDIPYFYVEYNAGPCALSPGSLHLATLTVNGYCINHR